MKKKKQPRERLSNHLIKWNTQPPTWWSPLRERMFFSLFELKFDAKLQREYKWTISVVSIYIFLARS